LSDGTRAYVLDASSIVPELSSLALLTLAIPFRAASPLP
jgi:hypothetical protein